MTAWRDLAPGDRVLHDGKECYVRVIRPSKTSTRVVLEPLAENLEAPSAKFSIRVKIDDAVTLPEGEERPDHAGDMVKEVLGATEVATIHEDGDVVCPAPELTTIMSHLKIMHGVELKGLPLDSLGELLKLHDELHEAPFHEPEHKHTHAEPEEDEAA